MTKKKLKKLVKLIDETLNKQNDLMVDMADMAEELERQLRFTRKLEAFLGPVIANKNPPLDGAQIATKAYVDEALARIARVLRSEREGAAQGSLS